jgi:phosphatidylethanolamine/phosphatidyl-N-methylethanolamine N-methyltransferase
VIKTRLSLRQGPVSDEIQFLRLWLRRPRRLGAVLPSSRALANAMAGCLDIETAGSIVELGGGTGSITRAMLAAGVSPDDLFVVEREAALCKVIAARCPDVRVLCGDARELKSLLRNAGVSHVKAIVSGLPFLSMDRRIVRRILHAAFAVLAEDGEFLQFTYGVHPPINRDAQSVLGIVGHRSGWVLANLPPAAIWRFRKIDAGQSSQFAA